MLFMTSFMERKPTSFSILILTSTLFGLLPVSSLLPRISVTYPYFIYLPPLSPKSLIPPNLSHPHQDLDKTQDEVLKHQASISQLKRSFMEAPPPSPPQPNQWEKRLTSSPATAIRVQQQQVVSVPQTEAASADNTSSDTKEPAKVVLTFSVIHPHIHS
ncbi:hypothetical protein XENORESO_004687 [Xenotaenia resolanae]|uniref:SAB domain-containing protein n=1 Tax=Xenotaenia resolanae TaxID=208358 RepID=A0ABV0W108_9TELE